MMAENRIEAMHGKLCVIMDDGSIMLEPQVDVDALHHPSHEYCQVEKNGKYGYIDMNGELVIPFQYDQAFPFSENGLAFVVGENGLGGYIDSNNEFIIEPIYDSGSMFKFGFAAVSKDGEYIYIRKNGSKAINHTFQYAGGFSECGLAKVVEFNGKHSLMSTTSSVVLRLKEGCELLEFKEDSRITKFRCNGKEALINAAGDIITGFYDEIIISPYARLHPFSRDGLWGYMDVSGNEIIPAVYKEASEFTEDKTAFVKTFHPFTENNCWEFHINEKDEIIDEETIESNQRHHTERFTRIHRFKKRLALAEKKENGSSEKVTESPTEPSGEMNDSPQPYDDDEIDDTIYDQEERDYEVEIFLYDKDEKAVKEFIEDECDGLKVLNRGNGYVKLLWTLVDWEERADIENVLYYALEGGEIGYYNCRKV